MIFSFRSIALCFVINLFATPALLAHPGHDLLDHGASHAVFSPDHLLILVLAGVLMAVFGATVKQGKARLVLLRSGAAMSFLAGVIWTISKCI